MFRFLLLAHRYLGIAIGLLVALWCLSAFVMMYVQFPRLSDGERLASLPAIDLRACCAMTPAIVDAMSESDRFVVESLADRPVVRTSGKRRRVFELRSGDEIAAVDPKLAALAAATYFRERGIGDTASLIRTVHRDQWTVAGYFDQLRPFYLFSADDDADSRIYISSKTGEAMQDSSGNERFWNWIGAVVHWIYPTVLRQNTAVWTMVVIWTTVISLFLTVFGIYLGILQFRPRRNGGRSPYRGMTLWHHYSGLTFGVFTVTWLISGLFSMNPWGMFESDSGERERRFIEAAPGSADDVRSFLTSLSTNRLPAETVRVQSAFFAGEFAVTAELADGSSTRLAGRTLATRPLVEQDLKNVPALIGAESAVLDAGWLTRDDAYYFSHHESVELPVYRVVLDDADRSRYYFHATSGRLIKKVDGAARGYRWWFEALHRGDFAGLSRQRPLWDIVMLTLLAGVTVGAVTGVYLGFRRLTR